MTATPRTSLPARHRTGAAMVHLGLPTALVALSVTGHLLAPAGPLRALLVAPALLWVPGRSLVAGLGIGRAAGRYTAALSVVLSLVALIAAGLLCQWGAGHVPLADLPLWVSALLLPLNLREWRDAHPAPRTLLAKARPVAVFGLAGAASAAVLSLVVAHLPTTAQKPYLSFSLGGSYTRISGVLPVRAGQLLTIPVSVSASTAKALPTHLSVTTEVDGKTVGTPVPVAASAADRGDAAVHVRVPHGCEHRVLLRLTHAGTELRSVDVYLRTQGETHCVRH